MYYDLNEKTSNVYVFICDFTREHGYSPSIREIGQNVGLKSSSKVRGYLKRLEECGYIMRNKVYPHTIQII